jgi:hypothetical protein
MSCSHETVVCASCGEVIGAEPTPAATRASERAERISGRIAGIRERLAEQKPGNGGSSPASAPASTPRRGQAVPNDAAPSDPGLKDALQNEGPASPGDPR